MIYVETIDEQNIRGISDNEISLIEKTIKEAAMEEGIDKGEVAVTLVDNERIHKLNKDYRGIDRPTDVLSFAMNEQGEDELDINYEEEDVPNMLGDIIISIPKVIEQANEYGHSFERELGFLIVHGFLHLLGYDHDNEEEEKEMFAKQEVVLERLKLIQI